MFVYTKLSSLCSGVPLFRSNIMRGKMFFSLTLQTRQLSCLFFLKDLFLDHGKKVIKPELFHYFDIISFAH